MASSDVALIARELGRYGRPDLYPFLVGLHVAGPTILELATPEQRARWLPVIRSGEEIWCQLFSEPAAGSDLANVSTRAVRDGDEWRVTGQKLWSSRAHYARRGFLLARTDPDAPKHAGITAFALDLRVTGIDVRPLRQTNGDAHFSEVFLDGALVADADRLGAVGEGWVVARADLTAAAEELVATLAAGGGPGARVGQAAVAGVSGHGAGRASRARGGVNGARRRFRRRSQGVAAFVEKRQPNFTL